MVDVLFAGVIIGAVLVGILVGFLAGRRLTRATMSLEVSERVQAGREDALKRQRAVVGGKLLEKLAPYLPEFPYDPTDLRFLGDPVDFVLFRGHALRRVEEIVFIEIKSGKSRIKGAQPQIQEAVEAGRVRWQVIRVGEQ